jgi:dihydrofolate reductase
MRELVLKMSITLDGFVCGPNGELNWLFSKSDEAGKAWTVASIGRAGIHLMGSRTYYDMATWWPTSTDVFAPAMNEIPKAVYTRSGTLHASPSGHTTPAVEDALHTRRESGSALAAPSEEATRSWSSPTVLSGDLATAVTRLKNQPGKPIFAHGGARFAQSLAAIGLIDEYQLLVYPVALGSGKPLFSELSRPLSLDLVNAATFANGVAAHVYRPTAR